MQRSRRIFVGRLMIEAHDEIISDSRVSQYETSAGSGALIVQADSGVKSEEQVMLQESIKIYESLFHKREELKRLMKEQLGKEVSMEEVLTQIYLQVEKKYKEKYQRALPPDLNAVMIEHKRLQVICHGHNLMGSFTPGKVFSATHPGVLEHDMGSEDIQKSETFAYPHALSKKDLVKYYILASRNWWKMIDRMKSEGGHYAGKNRDYVYTILEQSSSVHEALVLLKNYIERKDRAGSMNIHLIENPYFDN